MAIGKVDGELRSHWLAVAAHVGLLSGCRTKKQNKRKWVFGCWVGLGDWLTNGDDVDDDAIRRTQACACRCCLYV